MIAIDALGGDHAPGVVLDATLAAAAQGVSILLCGPQKMLEDELAKKNVDWRSLGISIEDAPDVLAMDEEPVMSVRKKPHSSLVKTVQMVASGHATCAVSAGNSGAFVVAASFIFGRQEGIERPALAGFLPTSKGYTLVLDLGANTEVRAGHLVQFAHLGSKCYQEIMGTSNPRVALLSNGHEERKGSLLTKEAYLLLKEEKTLNFIGNAEPYHLYNHEVDVLVCDGFSGNVLLKTMESVFTLTRQTIKHAFDTIKYSDRNEKNLVQEKLSDAFSQTDAHLDYRRFGGALVLGVRGRAIVCHGAADSTSLENALILAHRGKLA